MNKQIVGLLRSWFGGGLAVAFAGLLAPTAYATTFVLPRNGDSVVGELAVVTSEHQDDLSDLAYTYDVGYEEMRSANPKVDFWLPGKGTEVLIPSQFVLPDAPHEGIVINLPEMRLYYYPRVKAGPARVVTTYPVSIGPQDWKTPQGVTKIMTKKTNPSWTPPASIRAEHAKDGDILPKVVPGGPDNPLGQFALSLGHAGYLIHGTNKPYGVGMRVTHGCMRLYPKDIEHLFQQVPVGTPVRIVNQPYKVGYANGELYLEVHPNLEEDAIAPQVALTKVNAATIRSGDNRTAGIDPARSATVGREGPRDDYRRRGCRLVVDLALME
jgi:L,D-transpeptidase ErfK/SrfK